MAAAVVSGAKTRTYILGAAAALGLIFALTRMGRMASPAAAPPPTVHLLCVDKECGKRYWGEARGKSPYPCDKCGKQTAYRALRCRSCKKVSAHMRPELGPAAGGAKDPSARKETLAERLRPKCAFCGSRSVRPVRKTPAADAK